MYFSNKTEGLNLNVCNMITRTNKGETLTKHISCDCKSELHGKTCNPN